MAYILRSILNVCKRIIRNHQGDQQGGFTGAGMYLFTVSTRARRTAMCKEFARNSQPLEQRAILPVKAPLRAIFLEFSRTAGSAPDTSRRKVLSSHTTLWYGMQSFRASDVGSGKVVGTRSHILPTPGVHLPKANPAWSCGITKRVSVSGQPQRHSSFSCALRRIDRNMIDFLEYQLRDYQ